MPARKLIDWLRCAADLAAAVPRARLHPAVLARAERSAPGTTWAVAFSGGADSLALLLLIWAHWPRRRGRLVALHFNHRLRGRASDGDEKFCARVCAGLGVRLVTEKWVRAPREASEAAARAARMAFFERHGKIIWLGHQQGDVAETMLMRLARGSGTGGLAAPRPVQAMPVGRVHLRPLLGLKKEEICAALQDAGAIWREDASNGTAKYFRNRVRHRVVKVWCAAAERDGLAGAALSRELLEEDDEALEVWVGQLAPLAADGSLNLRRLEGKPRAVWRRALHRWLLRQPGAGKNLSRQAVATLLGDAMRGGPTRQSLGTAGFAVIAGHRLRFAAARRKK